ncbi:hypothetical protein AAEH74_21520, partial [Shewanella algae]
VCAYAVMSNHYHLVLKIDLAAQQALSPFEVIERWTLLFSGNPVAAKFLKGDSLSDGERKKRQDSHIFLMFRTVLTRL